MTRAIRFTEIEAEVPKGKPGIYEIHTDTDTALKVGIGLNLRERLLQHRASRDSGLKLKPGGNWANPRDVISKKSVLAKHLYFDDSITANFNLKSESGRRLFLESMRYISFEIKESLASAKEEESRRERHGSFRYIGNVVKR